MENKHSVSSFPDRLKKFRTLSGMTQPELAQALGVHPSYISQMERGVKMPRETLQRVFELLENNPAYRDPSWRRLALDRVMDETPSAMTVRALSTARRFMPPPQTLPTSENPEKKESLPHQEYASAINMIGHLFEHHPDAFKAVLVTLKAVYETHKDETK